MTPQQATRVITALQKEVRKQQALDRVVAALKAEVTRQQEAKQ